MTIQPTIFGGTTGRSAEDMKRLRALAAQLMKGTSRTPRNAGEAIHSVANGVTAAILRNRAKKAEEGGRADLAENFMPTLQSGDVGQLSELYSNPYLNEIQQALIKQKVKDLPHYQHGTPYHPGGAAVVGEQEPEMIVLPDGRRVPAGMAGPEIVDMPQGSAVVPPQPQMGQPIPNTPQIPQPDPNLMPGMDVDPRGMFWQEDSSFQPGAEYRTADMSGIAPSGTGETNKLNAAARSFQGFMKSLQDYEDTFNNGGSTAWPGQRRDALSIAHRDLQMQMKELYNLGVLNGPDLDLMNQILIDPTSVGGNMMDALGIADMEQRVPANIKQVRQLMMNRTEPALQQLGIDPQQLMPKTPEPIADAGGWQVINGVKIRVKQ